MIDMKEIRKEVWKTLNDNPDIVDHVTKDEVNDYLDIVHKEQSQYITHEPYQDYIRDLPYNPETDKHERLIAIRLLHVAIIRLYTNTRIHQMSLYSTKAGELSEPNKNTPKLFYSAEEVNDIIRLLKGYTPATALDENVRL